MQDFACLHAHSAYSAGFGIASLESLVERAVKLNLNALAITDINTLAGSVSFDCLARKKGIRPIIGCELTVFMENGRAGKKAGKGKMPKSGTGRSFPATLVFLAQNRPGYQNLCRLVALANSKTPSLLNEKAISKHRQGLFVLSGALFGLIPRLVASGRLIQAKQAAQRLFEIFGPENFFLELVAKDFPDAQPVNSFLEELAGELKLSTVATQESFCAHKEDMPAVFALARHNRGKNPFAAEIFRLPGLAAHFKSPKELLADFAGNTRATELCSKIAEKCESPFLAGRPFVLPCRKADEKANALACLEAACKAGLEKKIFCPDLHGKARYWERLSCELKTIEENSLTEAFISIYRQVQSARKLGVEAISGWGQINCSLVSFALGITDLDPIRHGLYFERFISSKSRHLPVFGLELGLFERERLLSSLAKQADPGKMAFVATYQGFSNTRAAKIAASFLNLEFEKLPTAIQGLAGSRSGSLANAVSLYPEVSALVKDEPVYGQLLHIAGQVGSPPKTLARNAARVIIASENLCSLLPLATIKNSFVCQYDDCSLDKIGVISFAFMGSMALSAMEQAAGLLRQQDKGFSLTAIPTDDSAIFEFLAAEDLAKIEGLQTKAMQKWIRMAKPKSLEEVAALFCLYRPGPLEMGMMKDFCSCSEKPLPFGPRAWREILAPTRHQIVFFEQVMALACLAGGLTSSEADDFRRDLGKRNSSKIDQWEKRFLAHAQNGGFSVADAEKLFIYLVKFGSYTGSKSYYLSRALIAYRFAWIKTHHREIFVKSLS